MVRLGELMMILELHRQGVSVTAIACRTGRDPKTVRKYIERRIEAPVYRAKTKGKVERPFSYIRQDFCLGHSFRHLDDLNAQLIGWLDTVANARVGYYNTRRPHSTLAGRTPDEAYRAAGAAKLAAWREPEPGSTKPPNCPAIGDRFNTASLHAI